MIDRCSQLTFVSKGLSRRLQLKCVRYSKMALPTLACASTQESHKRRSLELKLRRNFNVDRYEIEATEIPMICQDISSLKTGSVFVADMEKR